jgi:hypothetical protein
MQHKLITTLPNAHPGHHAFLRLTWAKTVGIINKASRFPSMS